MAQSTSSSDIWSSFSTSLPNFPYLRLEETTVVRRSFQSPWFHHWKWIDYDATIDAAFLFSYCFLCSQNVTSQKIEILCFVQSHITLLLAVPLHFSLLRLC